MTRIPRTFDHIARKAVGIAAVFVIVLFAVYWAVHIIIYLTDKGVL